MFISAPSPLLDCLHSVATASSPMGFDDVKPWWQGGEGPGGQESQFGLGFRPESCRSPAERQAAWLKLGTGWSKLG